MSRHVPDSTGLLWYFQPNDQEDAIDHIVKRLHALGFPQDEIVLPDEFPRLLICRKPDWKVSSDLWKEQGNSKAFRDSVTVNIIREVIIHDIQPTGPQNLPGTASG